MFSLLIHFVDCAAAAALLCGVFRNGDLTDSDSHGYSKVCMTAVEFSCNYISRES